MKTPLSKSQEALRGRRIQDMTDAQLREWINACDVMKHWRRTPNKARRGWTASRAEAIAELDKRVERARGRTSGAA